MKKYSTHFITAFISFAVAVFLTAIIVERDMSKKIDNQKELIATKIELAYTAGYVDGKEFDKIEAMIEGKSDRDVYYEKYAHFLKFVLK